MRILKKNLSSTPALLATLLALAHSISAQETQDTCNGKWNLTSKNGAEPVVAAGWKSQLVYQDIDSPRSIVMTPNGSLLILSQGVGIMSLDIKECEDGRYGWAQKRTLKEDKELNHGLQLSADGETLYASTNDAVYSWPFIQEPLGLGEGGTLITGMRGGGHVTRTILLSKKTPGWILVSHGSDGNLDDQATNLTSGSAKVKAFYIANFTDTSPPYDYVNDGILLGSGLRNSVGLAEEPSTGGLFAVENSADDLERDGTDIHETNPGEEMNFLGMLSSTPNNATVGGNFGYPRCFAVYDTNIPSPGNLKVGSHFALNSAGTTNPESMVKEGGDDWCKAETVKPRLTFPSHNAPLDIKFNLDGTEAYVAFHGSWNSPHPVGYRVSAIAFKDGQPVDAPDSTTALKDIFSNKDLSKCPRGCFRPAGLYMDHGKQRLWVTSDSTNEIWALSRTNETADTTAAPAAGSTAESTAEPTSDSGASGFKAGMTGVAAVVSTIVFAVAL